VSGNRAALRRGCRDNGIVATWQEFETGAPQMAAVAAMLWPGITALDRGQPAPADTPCFPVAFLATMRPDGSPRLHPFCPVLAGGRLLAAIPRSSPKGNDLRREPRCAIHALPGPEDDELSIRARAREAGNDPGLRAAALAVVTRSSVGGMIQTVSDDPIFEFDILRVDTARWLDIGQPGTRPVRQTWRARR
jgi:Pyridoxamine 5'-phosphate oxidase